MELDPVEDEDLVNDVPWGDIVPRAIKWPIRIYRNRRRIQSLWTRGVHRLSKGRWGKTSVVVLGRPGVGKSVLLSRLQHADSNWSWDVPPTSRSVESAVINIGEWARLMRVIPGQTVTERDLGLHEAFNSHSSLRGVIYVSDSGYTVERDPVLRASYVTDQGIDTVDKLRQLNMRAELRDLEVVCGRIRESISRTGRPRWLLILVNKADLFFDRIAAAEAYYHPKSTSPFGRILQELLADVGKNNLEIASAPLCAWRTDFEWNGHVVRTSIPDAQSERALFRFALTTIDVMAASEEKK